MVASLRVSPFQDITGSNFNRSTATPERYGGGRNASYGGVSDDDAMSRHYQNMQS